MVTNDRYLYPASVQVQEFGLVIGSEQRSLSYEKMRKRSLFIMCNILKIRLSTKPT